MRMYNAALKIAIFVIQEETIWEFKEFKPRLWSLDIRKWTFNVFLEVQALWTFLCSTKIIPVHAQQWRALQLALTEYCQITLTRKGMGR